jgi:hypothetical protein
VKPIIFCARGLWWVVKWPRVGRGDTCKAACVDFELRRLLGRKWQ